MPRTKSVKPKEAKGLAKKKRKLENGKVEEDEAVDKKEQDKKEEEEVKDDDDKEMEKEDESKNEEKKSKKSSKKKKKSSSKKEEKKEKKSSKKKGTKRKKVDPEETESDEETEEEKPKKKRRSLYLRARRRVKKLCLSQTPIIPYSCFKRLFNRALDDDVSAKAKNGKDPLKVRKRAMENLWYRTEGQIYNTMKYLPGILCLHQRAKKVRGRSVKQPEIMVQNRHWNMARAIANGNPDFANYGNKPSPVAGDEIADQIGGKKKSKKSSKGK